MMRGAYSRWTPQNTSPCPKTVPIEHPIGPKTVHLLDMPSTVVFLRPFLGLKSAGGPNFVRLAALWNRWRRP